MASKVEKLVDGLIECAKSVSDPAGSIVLRDAAFELRALDQIRASAWSYLQARDRNEAPGSGESHSEVLARTCLEELLAEYDRIQKLDPRTHALRELAVFLRSQRTTARFPNRIEEALKIADVYASGI